MFLLLFQLRQQQEMEDSINNLGLVTTDKDVNDLAARHCEDAQVSQIFVTNSFDISLVRVLPCRHPPSLNINFMCLSKQFYFLFSFMPTESREIFVCVKSLKSALRFLMYIISWQMFFHRCWRHTGPVSCHNFRSYRKESTENG